jgi:hypothetical protein
MEDILDGLRRVISRWVETVTPIEADVDSGDTLIAVASSKRFQEGDEVMIESPLEGEPNLVIEEIVDMTNIRLATPVFNDWTTDQNIVLRKLINGQFVEGIYIGDPEVIPKYPAISINGNTIDSEWMTLGSTKERYEFELGVYVEAANYENSYRFLMRTVKAIREGLKRNFYILVNDFDTTSIEANIISGDEVIRVADSSIFNTQLTDTTGGYPRNSDARAIIEDRWYSEETRVQEILSATTVAIRPNACRSYDIEDNPVLIAPHRFIYNTWPSSTQVGKVAKGGTLLQGAVIRWFAEEEVPFNFRNNDPHLK